MEVEVCSEETVLKEKQNKRVQMRGIQVDNEDSAVHAGEILQ